MTLKLAGTVFSGCAETGRHALISQKLKIFARPGFLLGLARFDQKCDVFLAKLCAAGTFWPKSEFHFLAKSAYGAQFDQKVHRTLARFLKNALKLIAAAR